MKAPYQKVERSCGDRVQSMRVRAPDDFNVGIYVSSAIDVQLSHRPHVLRIVGESLEGLKFEMSGAQDHSDVQIVLRWF